MRNAIGIAFHDIDNHGLHEWGKTLACQDSNMGFTDQTICTVTTYHKITSVTDAPFERLWPLGLRMPLPDP